MFQKIYFVGSTLTLSSVFFLLYQFRWAKFFEEKRLVSNSVLYFGHVSYTNKKCSILNVHFVIFPTLKKLYTYSKYIKTKVQKRWIL